MKVLGGILLAIGILVAGLSGLCSLTMLVGLGTSGSEGLGIAPVVLLFGGIPFAGGLALAYAGRSILRSANQQQQPPAPPASYNPQARPAHRLDEDGE